MSRIPENSEDHYVYKLTKPCGEIFYVGIGAVTKTRPLGFRARAHLSEARTFAKYGTFKEGANLFKLRTINKIESSGGEVQIVIESKGLSRKKAIELEVLLIRAIGRRDLANGPLTNLTDGGEGGYNPAKSTRDKIAAANQGKIVSTETRKRQSDARKGRIITSEWREKISNYQRGREHSPEWNKKVGEKTRQRWNNENYRKQLTMRLRRRWRVMFPDGHEEEMLGLTDLLAANPELKMSGLSQSGKKGKPYKGYLAYRLTE